VSCTRCGSLLGEPERVDVPYRSLPGVTLVGIEAWRCAAWGETEHAIPRIEALNRTIAAALVNKSGRLAAQEVRFLRRVLGWSGKDLASRIGVAPETVSRWENGALSIGETPDKLLRMFVVHDHPSRASRWSASTRSPGPEASL